MFWGKNIKSGEVYSFDSDKSILEQNLNITNISLNLSDPQDKTKYHVKIINNGQTYQLCTLDYNRESITTALSFIVKNGMKISVKGGNKGTVSLVGFMESFDVENEIEEINTDKIKEKKPKTEVIPELIKEKDKDIKKEKGIELEEDDDEDEEEEINEKDDDDDDELDDEMKEEEDDEEEDEDENNKKENKKIEEKKEENKKENNEEKKEEKKKEPK